LYTTPVIYLLFDGLAERFEKWRGHKQGPDSSGSESGSGPGSGSGHDPAPQLPPPQPLLPAPEGQPQR
jgi:hypothetical protein